LKQRLRQILLLPIVLAGVLCSARAGLKWESTLVREEAATGQSVVTAEFRFRNAGDQDAEIVSVWAS
jgi:hypothetical protein